MTRIKMHISKVKLPFYPPCEVKCGLRNGGSTVSIWQHRWLPRKHPPQVLSPMVDTLAYAKVATLIEETSRQWNHEMIDGIFTPLEAELIKAIPLSRCEAEDSLFWPFTNNGIYTSKSGFWCIERSSTT